MLSHAPRRHTVFLIACASRALYCVCHIFLQAKIAVVDVSLAGNAKIAEREQIIGYPTMLVYKHGARVNEYFGGRTQRYASTFML